MMRHSETMPATSRLLGSHPIVCLLAALAAVVVLGVLGPIKVVYAADVTVEGESFLTKPAAGTYDIITGARYSSGAALRFKADVTASHPVNCSAPCDVVLMASGGQTGGQPTFSVNGLPAQALTSTTTTAYTFHLPDGASTISVRAGGTGAGHNAILDVVEVGGGTDPGADRDGDTIPDASDNCPDVYNPNQGDDDKDGVGNKCDDGSTTPPPSSDWPTSDCEKEIRPGQDIDSIINNDASGTATTFCVYAGSYTVSAPAILKAGDKLKGEPNPPLTPVGLANKPTPVVKLTASGSENLLRANGNDISITWVDLSGADGTGNGTGAIAAGSAGSDFLVQFARIHENDSLGISSMKGTVLDSEFYKNSLDPTSLGFNGSAVKGITEYEAGRVYVHDEQGNGLWCDVGCSNDLARTKGFWVHDSVVVDGGRAGIRYENSSSDALFQNNVVRGNGSTDHRGGIDIRDSQHAQVLNNTLSANNGIGVRATDSGRSDRVNLERILVQGNDLGGDRIVTCGGPVQCIDNTNVGSR